MKKWFSLALTALMLLTACGGDDPTRPNVFAPLTAITVTPPPSQSDPSLLALNTSVQLAAEGIFDNGEFTRTITDECTWTSSNTDVLDLVPGSRSRFLAKRTGSARIVASRASIDGTIIEGVYDVTVTDAVIDTITITPTAPSVTKGLTEKLTAMGAFSDGTRQDITLDASWSSSDTTKATIAATGIVTGVADGDVTITASFGGKSATAAVKIIPAVLQSISISPSTATLIRTAKETFTVTGRYNNNTTAPVTTGVTWGSSTPAAARIDAASGIAEGVAPGTTTITAKVAGVADATATLSVVAPTSLSINDPGRSSIAVGEKIILTATATYNGNKTLDVTQTATWAPTSTSSPNSPATVSDTTGSKGEVTGNRTGNNITIRASLDGIEASRQISVVNGGAQ